jgi:hypothetical protein
MAGVAGQVPYSVSVAAIGGAVASVGLAGLFSPIGGGVAVGAGVVLLLAELVAVARGPKWGGLVAGAVGVSVVVVVADGLVDLSLPALIAGAGGAQVFTAAVRYAEHVIAVEGPKRSLSAVLRRLTLPVHELFLALGGQSLSGSQPLPPRLPSRLPPPSRRSRETPR